MQLLYLSNWIIAVTNTKRNDYSTCNGLKVFNRFFNTYLNARRKIVVHASRPSCHTFKHICLRASTVFAPGYSVFSFCKICSIRELPLPRSNASIGKSVLVSAGFDLVLQRFATERLPHAAPPIAATTNTCLRRLKRTYVFF